VPESAITRDYAGLRTLDSVVRCRRVFGQTSVVIVSLRFHAERALYLARSEAVADTTVGRSPRYLGDPVRIGES
jgi:SanA protein